MKRMIGIAMLAAALIPGAIVNSQETKAPDLNKVGRYMPCENYSGGGFYWVDTSTGKIWWAVFAGKEKIDLIWKYIGQGKDVKPGEIGTYIPFPGKNSGGLFVLNTITGEGWWTNGKDWKEVGKPSDVEQSEKIDPTVTSQQPDLPNVPFTCVVQAETEVLYEIDLDGKFVSSGKTFPPEKGLLQSMELTAIPGDHILTVTAPGYETWQKKVTIVNRTSNTKYGPSFRIVLKKSEK